MRHWPRRVAWLAALLSAVVPVRRSATLRAQTAPVTVASPDGRNVVTVAERDGTVLYAVRRGATSIVQPSHLGFAFRGAPSFRDSLRVARVERAERDTAWSLPWGEVTRVREHYREARLRLAERRAPARQLDLVVRAFDDGVAFRYEFPADGGWSDLLITEELTEFTMADNAEAWWIPSYRPREYEYLYRQSHVSSLDTVQTPLTMHFSTGPYVVIHEAELVDYAGLSLRGNWENDRTLRPVLAPWADGVAVRGRAPFRTPWRTLQLADRAEDLAPSVLGLKLNPPSAITDTRWITPTKYNGIWWGMHLGLFTWGTGAKHGATTANAKRYIDFAATHGLGGTLVEGWNLGWDGDWITHGDRFSFTRPTPDFDLEAVAAYARAKGVRLVGHHETGMAVENYEAQLDSAFALYRRLGVTAVKTGYVGDKTRDGHAHHSQYMVRHYRKVVETAAKYGIMVDAHEPIHDTGERRTWPNMLTREGARGQEYNAGGPDGGNPPEHESVLFFTRLLAGPMDYTPGIFDVTITRPTGTPRPVDAVRPRTTVAKQLAQYVVLWSPLQMAADLPENYEGQPAYRFIRDVAVSWDETKVLSGAIGDHVVVARKAQGRDEWFIGAVTDEQARTLTVSLSFLRPGQRYVAEIYADGPGAHWATNPTAVAISQRTVTSATPLTIRMAAGGGQAIRLRPAP